MTDKSTFDPTTADNELTNIAERVSKLELLVPEGKWAHIFQSMRGDIRFLLAYIEHSEKVHAANIALMDSTVQSLVNSMRNPPPPTLGDVSDNLRDLASQLDAIAKDEGLSKSDYSMLYDSFSLARDSVFSASKPTQDDPPTQDDQQPQDDSLCQEVCMDEPTPPGRA